MLDATAFDVLLYLFLSWANHLLNRIVRQLLQPTAPTILIGAITDFTLGKSDLIAENALLRLYWLLTQSKPINSHKSFQKLSTN
jgi:hypothetical protein